VARLLRSSLPDGIYHVTGRAVAGSFLFREDDDRLLFLLLLLRVARRHEWEVHALCLMGTHYHLIVETTQPELSAGFQRLNGRYAQAYNAKYGRAGHVFGARFSSWVVESDAHFAASIRYVLGNPVRAGLCARPEDWRWSGARRRLDPYAYARTTAGESAPSRYFEGAPLPSAGTTQTSPSAVP
jgi:REP element-mobilizing transposase RayT